MPRAMCALRKSSRASLSSLRSPTMLRVTVASQSSLQNRSGKAPTPAVDEQALLARGRVRAHDGVFRLHWLAPDDAAALAAALRLLEARVHGLEPVQALLEQRRQAVVGLDVVRKGRVPADRRAVEDVQEGSPRRLLLVRDVRVPADAAVAVAQVVVELALARVAV